MKPAPPVMRYRKEPSLQFVGIVLVCVCSMRNRTVNRNLIFVTLFQGFLRAVAVRIGIVAIRVVIVGRTRIDGIENHTEDVAFHGGEEVAGARKSFLGSFAAANDKKDAI